MLITFHFAFDSKNAKANISGQIQDYTKLLLNILHTLLETADCHLQARFNVNSVTVQTTWMPPPPIQAIIYSI
jgi:hypothetical protein